VASSRLHLEQAKKGDAARKQLREQEKLRVEAELLLLEIREAEDRNHHRKVGDNEDRRESTWVRKETHQNYREIRRREHYREWLATQNVLDSMRQADLRDSGQSNIPARDKRPAYGGYPRSEISGQQDQNQ
jgi:hypothetical protein